MAMKLKTQKVIAREGLILISLCVFWFLVSLVLYLAGNGSSSSLSGSSMGTSSAGLGALWYFFIFILLQYLFYWTIRFIIWAIKTLRIKEVGSVIKAKKK
ncbi:hypothetical protein ACFL58_01415 [Elusimicrobiota bacterium]